MCADKDENGMNMSQVFRRGAVALILCGLVLPLGGLCQAQPATDADFAALQAEVKNAFRDRVTPFVRTYCVDCHGNRPKAGVNFLSALKYPGNPGFSKHWKQAIINVKAHDMPPDDADKQPSDEERQMFVNWIAQLKFLSPPDPGPFVIRRLNKVEYGNTLRDLFGVDPAVARELPDEVFGEGYLNTLSPLLSEQYLGIANDVLDRILAPADATPTSVQRRLFGAPPAPGTDARAAAREVARSLARSAYRRPPSEAELDVL